VVAIDVKRDAHGGNTAYSVSGTVPENLSPIDWAIKTEALGAGEILLTSIDQDGTMCGYDIPLIRQISDSVSIPVIASGGAGNYQHMANAVLEGRASAVAAASIYHFTHQTPIEAKRYLAEMVIPIRL
jgi:cyclase